MGIKNAGLDVFHFFRKGKLDEKNKTFKIDILDERKGFIKNNLTTYNKSMQRYTAHAANSFEEAKLNYYEILNTAKELNYKMSMYNELEKYVK